MAIGNQEPADIDLGFTSFGDGLGRDEGGFVYLNYLAYAEARSINGNDGKPQRVPVGPLAGHTLFNSPRINAFIFINQLVYIVPDELFGGAAHFGFDFVLPLIGFGTSFAPAPPLPGIQLANNGFGLGDLAVGPMLQFRPILSGGRPVFSARVEFAVIAPIGAYDPSKDFNQGANFASLNPYLSFTALPIRGLEFSSRLNYLYNFANHRPAFSAASLPPMAPPPLAAQAGQAFWMNFAASYEAVHTLHFGVNGYYFVQFTDDEFTYLAGPKNDGRDLGDSGRARSFALGPGMLWDISQHDKAFANAYLSVFADNGASYDLFVLHYVRTF